MHSINQDIRVPVIAARHFSFVPVIMAAAFSVSLVALAVALSPARASADFDPLYVQCHNHVDDNDNDVLDLLDSACDSVNNNVPEALDQDLTTNQDTAVSTTLTGIDTDATAHFSGDVLYFTIATSPSHGTLTCGASDCTAIDSVAGNTAGGPAPVVTYTPEAGYTGDDFFDFTASDGRDENDATVDIHVLATAPETCPEGQTGTPPDCTTPPPPVVCDAPQVLNEAHDACVDPAPENTGGGPDLSNNPECSDGIDNDNDGRTDFPGDNSCFDGNDDTEGNDGGGGFAGGFIAPPGGNGGAGSGNTAGLVLGASTDIPSCANPLLNDYIHYGRSNKIEQVKKLQQFLNDTEGANLEITGIYDEPTMNAVMAFQLKYWQEILMPWKPFGLGEHEATGYVYKTTLRMINNLSCSSLNIPLPQLP